MSTTPAAGPAPWRKLFLEHIEAMKPPIFSLSTVRKVKAPATPFSGSPVAKDSDGYTLLPRGRTCTYRSMWACLPVNPKNPADLNPDVYESDLPVFTTDVRMDKMPELWGLDADSSHHDFDGTGGGAPVEAVWWAAEPLVQWRVRGRAYVLGPDVESSEAGKKVQEILRQRMRLRASDGKETEKEKDWSFKREVTACFGNLNPVMRGSFRNPPPGTPLEIPLKDERLKLGQKVEDLQDEVARKNFRVVVLVPFEVDRVDLSDPARGRRWVYRFAPDGKTEVPGGHVEDGWEKAELWP